MDVIGFRGINLFNAPGGETRQLSKISSVLPRQDRFLVLSQAKDTARLCFLPQYSLIARVEVMRIKPNSYSYSEPIVIKEWSGGRVTVAVGYVTKYRRTLSVSRRPGRDKEVRQSTTSVQVIGLGSRGG